MYTGYIPCSYEKPLHQYVRVVNDGQDLYFQGQALLKEKKNNEHMKASQLIRVFDHRRTLLIAFDSHPWKYVRRLQKDWKIRQQVSGSLLLKGLIETKNIRLKVKIKKRRDCYLLQDTSTTDVPGRPISADTLTAGDTSWKRQSYERQIDPA